MWPSEIYLIISLLQSPSSIITIVPVILVVMEDCFIASTGMIRLIAGSGVEAKAARASAVVFSPLGIRVNSNFSNCFVISFTNCAYASIRSSLVSNSPLI